MNTPYALQSVQSLLTAFPSWMCKDSKRSNNVSIMLAQFRISYVDIKIAILELNEDILDAETVEKIFLHVQQRKRHYRLLATKGLKILGKAEQYVRYHASPCLLDLTLQQTVESAVRHAERCS